MGSILTSLHGRKVGIDKDSYLVAEKDFAHNVIAASTANTLLPHGLSLFSSTAAKVYAMSAPVPGVRKTLFCTAGTTAATHTITVSGVMQSTASQALTQIVLNGNAQSLSLIGLSTAAYGVLGNNGATLSS